MYENPLAQAICAWDGNFTYGELEFLSTSLAHRLTSEGVQGTRVPLLFEKSKWMPVAALAVMKAGGGSIAIDTNQPEARCRSILAHANSLVALGSPQNNSLAEKICESIIVIIVDDSQHWQTFCNPKLPIVQPSSILYVNFTSGTTGTAKGAINTHQGLCSSITYQQKALGFSNTSRVLDFASYAFDASWWNV